MYIDRREVVVGEDGNFYEVYDSNTSYIVKWVIFLVLVAVMLLWIVGGYIHAQRRMKRGLRPMAYHRWLVSRRQRAQFEPQRHFTFYQGPNQQGTDHPYAMQHYPAPPPMYNGDSPPSYYQPESQPKPSGPQTMGTQPQAPQEMGTTAGEPSNTNEPQLPPRAKTRFTNPLKFLRR